MYLYMYKGYKGGEGGRERSEDLVRKAAVMYINEEGYRLEGVSGQILREKRGRPYFKDVPLEFSVSHTGDLWVCLMDRDRIGVDIQKVREARQDKIMERFYTPEEITYVDRTGTDGFFQLWTRKEAFAKYLGTGIVDELKNYCTLTDKTMEFIDFDLRDDVKGSCCMKEKKELWIRKLG